ncbi:Sel1 repeat-containing protein [Anaerovibrio lipolyticus DSM 3074]|uniref:Sel1 repeat-containing protein n=1 Tax=Anaerovibrio lipolyticus DSM 3074 TaxID=1120997 RepID=A0A1M6BVR2_9FIRM|nr:PcfJ domain-containing protein [Anaerovibrio lipolyticus]SHI52850.1 Sel1 repeat-containing protein [Anaerovibrio lipolyticus DSM 3074]
MLDATFIYSYENGKWVRCTDAKYVDKDIEYTPCLTVVEYTGYPYDYYHALDTDYIFCPIHNTIEEIEEISDNHVVSQEGCCLDGLLGHASLKLSYMPEKHEMAFVPYRWRVFQRTPDKSTNIACDVMKVQYCRNGIIRRWLNYSLAVDFVKDKVMVSKIKQIDNTRIDWTETDIDVPDVVVETAIEAMRDNTLCATGIKPSVLCQIKNKTTLLGYIERPFDVNIVFLKKFFQEFIKQDDTDVFDEIFTKEEKNNYKIICDLLEINPPKGLRKAYAFNPYAIVWYMIFKQWGIKDINFMHKFFYLDDCIANLYLHRFHYDREEKCVTRDVAIVRWIVLEFYCKWLLEQKGEKKMLKWLYVVSRDASMTELQWDILNSFHAFYKDLSEEVIARLLKDGLTDYVHDAISTEVTALSEKWESTKVKYNKIEQTYACRINGYEFRLLPNTRMLSKIGAAFNNCVATYRDRILNRESVIVYVMNKEEYSACIELKKGCHIVQASGKYNRQLDREVNNVCFYWAKHNHLEIDVDDIVPMSPEELKEFDDVIVEPIPYEKSIDEMNLEELVNIDEDKICDGYYLMLEWALRHSNKYPLSAPYWMEFTDEISRLTYLLPEGERIFKAAGSGNTEAMIALGRMYFRGRVIRQDYDKSLEWLERAGQLGNLKGCMIAHKVRDYMNRDLSDRDRAILLGLSELRHRVAVGGLG